MKDSTANYLDKSLLLSMLGFVFLNPIPHTTTIKEILFYLSCIIFSILVATKKINFTYKTPLTIPFLLFGLWAFLGLFFALDKPSSIHDYYAHYIKYIIFYFIFINVFSTPKRFNLVVWAIIISAVGFSSWALIKYYIILSKPFGSRMGSASGLPEFITNISELITMLALVFSLNLLLAKKSIIQKVILAIGIIPLFAATILPQSVSSIVALTIALIVFICNKPKTLLTIAVATTILFIIAPLPNRINSKLTKGDDARAFLYFLSIEIIRDYPIIGTGFDLKPFRYLKQSFPDKFKSYTLLPTTKKILENSNFLPKKRYNHQNGPHNMFLSTAIRTGVVGLLMMGFIMLRNVQTLYGIARKGDDKDKQEWGLALLACFFMFLTKGTFEQVYIHFGDTLYYSLLGMTAILWRLSDHKRLSPA